VAKKILWNEEAVKQGAVELDLNDLKCPDGETNPRLRQFGRASCECGSVEGAASDYANRGKRGDSRGIGLPVGRALLVPG
jgi:hypothetical protein